MKIAGILTGLVYLGLVIVDSAFGHHILFRIASGGIVIMSAIIAVTFFWLWQARATPLALGMGFSWSGGALVLAWWWVLAANGASSAMTGHPALIGFIAIFTTGAVLHFAVIGSSFHWPRHTASIVPFASFAVSAFATYLI